MVWEVRTVAVSMSLYRAGFRNCCKTDRRPDFDVHIVGIASAHTSGLVRTGTAEHVVHDSAAGVTFDDCIVADFAYSFRRGSSASRKPFPTRLNASAAM